MTYKRLSDWRPGHIRHINNRPFVYDTKGKYRGRYYDYRMSHPGTNYLQLLTTRAKIRLTRAQVTYLVWCDSQGK